MGLRTLSLRGNAVEDLTPLASLTGLAALDLEANAIADIGALSGLTSLTELSLGDNVISNVDAVSGMAALTVLHLDYVMNADGTEVVRLTEDSAEDSQPQWIFIR